MSSLLTRLASIVLVIGLLAGSVGSVVAADDSPVITTDKTKYTLGETMVISGTGFTPDGTVNIEVQLPGNNGIDTLAPVPTDAAGSFQTSYTPPTIPGRYKITATDGVDTAKTAATEADLGNEDFYGWNMATRTSYPTWPGDWHKGNLGKNWREGDWVSYVLVLNGYGGTVLPNFDIRFDFLQASSDGILCDLARNFRYMIRDPYPNPGTPTDITPANANTWGAPFTPILINRPFPVGSPDSPTAPGDFAYFTVQPNSVFSAPVTAGKSVVIYFEMHLARTFVWNHGLEYDYNNNPTTQAQGGSRYGPPYWGSDWTAKHLGSGYVTGASGHLVIESTGVGAKTVPIPIPPKPAGMICGLKWHDLNADGIKDVN